MGHFGVKNGSFLGPFLEPKSALFSGKMGHFWAQKWAIFEPKNGPKMGHFRGPRAQKWVTFWTQKSVILRVNHTVFGVKNGSFFGLFWSKNGVLFHLRAGVFGPKNRFLDPFLDRKWPNNDLKTRDFGPKMGQKMGQKWVKIPLFDRF